MNIDQHDKQLDQQIAQQDIILSMQQLNINDLQILSQNIQSHDLLKIHHGIIGIRKFVSEMENIQHIQQIIDNDLITRIIDLIKQNIHPLIVKEATWALTNMLSGTKEQTEFVFNQGALQVLLELLHSNCDYIAEQAVWGLGNIAAEGSYYTNIIIQTDAIEQIAQIYENAKVDGKETCIWAIRNITKFINLASYNQILISLKLICNHIKQFPNSMYSLNDQLASLLNLCNIIDQIKIVDILQIFQSELIKVLIQQLENVKEDGAVLNLLKILQLILPYDNNNLIIQNTSIQISKLLGHKQIQIRQETLNFFMKFNNKKQIDEAEDINIIQQICLIIKQDDYETKIIVLFKLQNKGINAMINYLKNPHYLIILNQTKSMIVSLIIVFLNDILIEIFDLLEEFLKLGNFHKPILNCNPCLEELQQQNGFLILEQLQLHQDCQVYQKAYNIITKYIDYEEI